ncbi:autoaggregation protein [Rhizobium bangladeshense]|uniref:Autoaggregation protein n=1 Tax=Rhizobium bangladeshense TaxID=1138189 RepID=A0ABS7LNQ9_9HYPH|nr:Ig-like domain-containing protein [Rhizobium bangladeshense]MBX4886298.1 autoaggregation protein [Rhizobium bangladeshense]MBY3592809.1 autoaggregation protein [Rhizobium bangladeshense]MBY3614450.1 autoaggregation protein [Rhizobium bangladeshense]
MASLIHATDDSATFQETDVISGNLLSNDSSANGHLFLRAFDGASVGAKSGMNQITEIQGEYGTFFVKPDGSYTYVLSDAAKIGFSNGELLQEKVSYKISDGSGHTDVGLFTLNIQGVTQKPIAVDDVYSFTEGSPIAGNVLDNDIAGDNGKMFLRQFLSTQVDSKADAVTDIAGTYGTFHVKANGEFTYELTADLEAGQTYTEVLRYYKISDGEGHTDTAKVTLNILGTDALPDGVGV